MSGNSAFELVNEQGWLAGLKNLLRAEFRRWWKTRTWWIQSLIWIGVIDLLLLMVTSTANATGDPNTLPPEVFYGIFGGVFIAVGVIIQMQSAIIGEKISGAAAWLLSKPVARPAFVLSKLLGNALGVAVTAVLIPGIGAYLIMTIGKDVQIPMINFIGGMGVLCLYAFYWLSLTLMLGTFFNGRGPVIGIPLGLLLGQQFVIGLVSIISPMLADFLPFPLTIPVQAGGSSIAGYVITGTPLPTWAPVYSSVIAIVLFVSLGIWRFSREEL